MLVHILVMALIVMWLMTGAKVKLFVGAMLINVQVKNGFGVMVSSTIHMLVILVLDVWM